MFSMIISWLKKKIKNIYDNELQAHCIMSENNLNLLNEILLKTSFGALQVFNVFKGAAIIIFSWGHCRHRKVWNARNRTLECCMNAIKNTDQEVIIKEFTPYFLCF